MIEYTVKLFSDTNGFKPTTFSEWVGHEVQITGLDSGYRHVLRQVQVPDSSQAVLTINTYPEDQGQRTNLTPSLSVIPTTPRAQARLYNENNTHLVTVFLDAPLKDLSEVLIDNKLYQITKVAYPYRDTDHPESTEDYQLVTVSLVTNPEIIRSFGLSEL